MKIEIPVNKEELQAEITRLESEYTYANHSALALAVANTVWARDHKPKPITAAIVKLRIKKYGIEVKTPKGKKGRSAGQKIVKNLVKRDSVADDKALLASTPKEFKSLVLKVINSGSKIGRIKINCLACTNWDRKEVKLCDIKSCPMHPIRPYQPK